MKRAVIIAAAPVAAYERIKNYLDPENDFYIVCDGGLNHVKNLGIIPDLIIGDFDSHENPLKKNPELSEKTIILPRAKDDTDSFYAVKTAVEKGFENFLLIGMTGARFDHSLVNLSVLLYLHKNNKTALLLDDFGEMEIVAKTPVYVKDNCKYFSLMNICGTAKGINITGAHYPLTNGTITCDYQYGCSNEVLPGQEAKVSVEEGNLLLIKIFQEN